MALLEGNLIDPQHGEGWNLCPINLGINPAIKHPEHRIGQGIITSVNIIIVDNDNVEGALP